MNATTDLFPHQRRAVDKLLPARVGALFMEMGTGKTRVAIEFALRRRARIDRVVWFCPVSLKATIETEILKHTDLPADAVYRFDGRTRPGHLPPALFYIVGIESMSASGRAVLAVNELITDKTFVIVDESDYIKGHSARRTQRITLLAERAKYRMILTGTPLSQGVVDLYAQMRFLSPLILGYRSFHTFARKHLEYSERFPGLIVSSHHTEQLAARVQPYTYQVTKAECLDLPDKLFDARYYDMTLEQRDGYERAKREILLERTGNDWEDQLIIFRVFTALQQIVAGYWKRRDPETGQTQTLVFAHDRLPLLAGTLAGIPETEKVLLWCKYHRSIDAIVERLAEAYGAGAVAQFHGGLSESARNAEISRFRSGARFLVATQAAGGHGLTLTEARYAVFYENEFKYAHRQQAEDRQHRIGQARPVTYIDLVCRRSIDERIQAALAAKEDVADSFRRQVDRVKDDPAKLEELVRDL